MNRKRNKKILSFFFDGVVLLLTTPWRAVCCAGGRGDCVGLTKKRRRSRRKHSGDWSVDSITKTTTNRTKSRANPIIIVVGWEIVDVLVEEKGEKGRVTSRRAAEQGYRHLIFMNEFLFDVHSSRRSEQKQR